MAQNALQKSEGRQLPARGEHTQGVWFTPRVDILETEDELTLFADMPGVRPDDVDVRFQNGELVLHGRVAPRQLETAYTQIEYGVGDFYRTFTVGEDIDAGKISAELKNGVLTVHLPRRETARPRKITVQGA